MVYVRSRNILLGALLILALGGAQGFAPVRVSTKHTPTWGIVSTSPVYYYTETQMGCAQSSSTVGDDPIKLIISGAPASGKGTQCAYIKDNYGVVHLSTGDMLRAAVADATEVGVKAKEFMDAGKLVPDEIIIGVVKDRLAQEDCTKNGWLLDGFPRTQGQAVALADAGVEADCFIFLQVPDEILVERVVGRRTDPETGAIYHMKFSPPEDETITSRLVQRSDDTEEKVAVRLEQFHANVDAVKGSYESISVDIDGTKPPTEVAESIKVAIASKIPGKA
mmetsp:Transcript_14554/g.22164  ORF Transcript_14554/g.22164 Transcript_14554/m.22164 type:complete len:279 (+) Transcript_14554:40-876(+)